MASLSPESWTRPWLRTIRSRLAWTAPPFVSHATVGACAPDLGGWHLTAVGHNADHPQPVSLDQSASFPVWPVIHWLVRTPSLVPAAMKLRLASSGRCRASPWLHNRGFISAGPVFRPSSMSCSLSHDLKLFFRLTRSRCLGLPSRSRLAPKSTGNQVRGS